MPSHRRRNSLPASYKVPITQPSFSPTMLFHDEKSATQYLKKIVRHVKLGGGIITLAQLGRLRIQFEEITHFLISNGFSTHPDEFTVYFWNCLSPQLKSAMSDALIWDGHMILADIYSIETLPPYNILIQYIHRCYSSPDNPKETPSRIYITSQENQQSNQNYSTHSSMKERETEDQSPVTDFVSLDTPSFQPLTPVDVPGEIEFEGIISHNVSEETESVLDLVQENQSFNMNSVENLPEESIMTGDSSFKVDHPYFLECHSQSEWEFQSILSKTSSLSLLETINPLHFMPEEPFLTKSEDQDYISPSLIPSSPAFTKALEISTSESVKQENHVQKDPGKNSEPMIKPNPISQQESSCDPIHLPEIRINEEDLQLVKPPRKSISSLKPLWNFLSGCLVLLLSLSGTGCSVVVDRAGLEGISVGSGGEKNQNYWLSKILSSIAWKEELGLVPALRIKDRSDGCTHQNGTLCYRYLFAATGLLGWTWIWIRMKKKENGSYSLSRYVDRIRLRGGTFNQTLRLEKGDDNFFDHRWRNLCEVTSTHVFNIFGNGIHRKGYLLVLALIFLLYLDIPQTRTTLPIGRNFHTQVFNSGRLVVSESSLSIVVRRHKSHCQPSAPAVKSGRAQQKSLWTSRWKRDRKRVTDDDSEQPVRPLFQVYMSNGRINRSFAHFCLIDYLAHTSPGPSAFRFGSKSKKQAPEDDSVCCQRLPFADPMMRTLQGISRTRVESGYVAVLLVVTVENSKSMKWKT
ncbi:hypothetical protein PSTT_14535 [Puccinia striiformis]|uniref:Uncharacterized protein n=1 Tax=Puccinia striiformis TaxID=27350 RepID=A0A2S4ULV0_9BASI|nr:hypothetical protein PSTT_14535 [Puccinia striiformis]